MNNQVIKNPKKKKAPQRSLGCGVILKWIGIAIAIIVSPIVIYYGTIFLWLNQGNVRSSLPDELIPIAEYLLDNPQVEPPLTDSEFYVDVTDIDRNSREICFVIASGQTGYDYLYSNNGIEINALFIEILINENLAGRSYTGLLSIYHSMNAYITVCIDGVLEDGLHVIELRAMDSAFSQPNYTKQWVVAVNCTYENCVVNSVPSSLDFHRARHAMGGISPISEDLSLVANTLPTDYDYYDDVELEINDISVPTRNATEVCFIFAETPVLSDGDYPNVGHISINLGREHTLFYNNYTNSNRICSDYRVPIGANVITLQLPNREEPYQWAIEIE
ncbi:MAG: hypothetical protein Phog2KO_04000 [Phototrophicaceae bacterium]